MKYRASTSDGSYGSRSEVSWHSTKAAAYAALTALAVAAGAAIPLLFEPDAPDEAAGDEGALEALTSKDDYGFFLDAFPDDWPEV